MCVTSVRSKRPYRAIALAAALVAEVGTTAAAGEAAAAVETENEKKHRRTGSDESRELSEASHRDESDEREEEEGTEAGSHQRPHSGGVSRTFPMRLHALLEKVEAEGQSSIISWLDHGRAFMIHKHKEFSDTILPKYFPRQTKLTSFQRQLNLYEFVRLSNGAEKGAYYHEKFVRGEGHLCKNMRRIKIKGTGKRQKASPHEEPDFSSKAPLTHGSSRQKEAKYEADATVPAVSPYDEETDRQAFSISSHKNEQERQAFPKIELAGNEMILIDDGISARRIHYLDVFDSYFPSPVQTNMVRGRNKRAPTTKGSDLVTVPSCLDEVGAKEGAQEGNTSVASKL